MNRPVGRLIVAVPGTLVQATSLEPDPTKPLSCHAVLFQALPTNTGRVYVGTWQLERAALANCFAWLPIPTVNQAPSFSVALTIAPNALKLNDYWIDADVAGDGVIATILVT